MTIFLHNYLGGVRQDAADAVHLLRDPVTGEALAATGGRAEGLEQGFAFARDSGRAALQAMSYGQRAAMLGEVLKVLQANRDDYYAISQANSGTTQADSAVDIEGAAFTLNYYARLGASLGEARLLLDGSAAALARDGSFQSQHILAPVRGLAQIGRAHV